MMFANQHAPLRAHNPVQHNVFLVCPQTHRYYILFTFLTVIFFTYYGMMSVAISGNPQLAAIMSSGVYSVWFLLAGFFIPLSAMPPVSTTSAGCCGRLRLCPGCLRRGVRLMHVQPSQLGL